MLDFILLQNLEEVLSVHIYGVEHLHNAELICKVERPPLFFSPPPLPGMEAIMEKTLIISSTCTVSVELKHLWGGKGYFILVAMNVTV